jgi:hypothetical protein
MTRLHAIRRRDPWTEVAVVAMVVVALGAGWLLRQVVLFRATPFTIPAADISGRYPAGWVHEFGDDPLLRVRDPMGGQYDPTIVLCSRPLASDADPAIVLDTLALERANRVTAYRALDSGQVVVDGRAATYRDFAYVHVDPNPYLDRLPVVVRGIDLALRDEGRVIVVTFMAGEDDFDRAHAHFRALVESLEF